MEQDENTTKLAAFDEMTQEEQFLFVRALAHRDVLDRARDDAMLTRYLRLWDLHGYRGREARDEMKKEFADDGSEALAYIHSKGSDTIDTIHDEIFRQISICRSDDEVDKGTQSLNAVQSLPGFLVQAVGGIARFLDRHGWMPQSVIAGDPYYSSVVLTNLGSIKLHAGYHHLTNWGTTSVFCAIGEIKKRPFFNDDGTFEMKPSIDLGLTIDERIADGYYYAKTVRLLRTLLENPQLLDKPLQEEVDY